MRYINLRFTVLTYLLTEMLFWYDVVLSRWRP